MTYVEVVPNVRCEVVSRIGQPHHFAVLEVWEDQQAFEATCASRSCRRFRDTLGPMSGLLYDERMFKVVE